MPRGASPKREKEYKEIETKIEKEGRYPGREKEVAARIVNKQRAQYGETKAAKQKDKEGKSPDRDLPVRNYEHLTSSEVTKKLNTLSRGDLRKVENYEKKHKNRKGVLEQIEKRRSAGA